MNEDKEQMSEGSLKVSAHTHNSLGVLGTYMKFVSYVMMLLSLGGAVYALYYLKYKVEPPMFDSPSLDDRIMTEGTCVVIMIVCLVVFLINVHLMSSSKKVRKAVEVDNSLLLESGLMSVSRSMRIMGMFILLLVLSFIGWIAYILIAIDLP
ncbi:hypothetical protein [Myroides sp. N17-2]|uniref:hypothetical protein n=1 Tax=Myroides sp. N17-2 TaxID=2030799 RepID=UPI000EFB8141|nr:hypothetical protein [Myroides sp. N17-2]